MPSPPAPPGTVTDPIERERPVGRHGELVDDAGLAGLHVKELAVCRGRCGVHRARVGRGVAERGQAAGRADAGSRSREPLPALDA